MIVPLIPPPEVLSDDDDVIFWQFRMTSVLSYASAHYKDFIDELRTINKLLK